MIRLHSLLLIAILFFTAFNVNAQESEYNLDETYTIVDGGTLHLDSDDAEVEIEGTDRSDVHLTVYRRVDVNGWKVNAEGSFEVNVENRNGDLYIRENENDKFSVVMGSIDTEYRITIEAPRNISLNIEGDDDTYQISNINGSLKFSADDTEAEFTGMQGEEFDFDIDDGTIEMDQARGSLELDMDDGELYISEGSFSKVRADYDDGELDIVTSIIDDGSYDFDMDDGSLELNITEGGGEFEIFHDNGSIRADSKFEETSSDEGFVVYKLGSGNAQIDIDTDDGNVELRSR